MIRTCKNCAGMLKYDIQLKGLHCDNCGSTFSVSEYDDIPEGEEELLEVENMIDCNIYRCSACGAEISVTGTEASTFCIYCGNPTIIFSRVGRLKKPDMICPFKITKEEALSIVSNHIKSGMFIPKEIKNIEPELLRGIYIPYYVSHVEYDASMIIETKQRSGKSTHTYYHKRSGYASLPWVTTDASTTLSDSSSQRLEPYYMDQAKEFDENYLVGFYSDMSDVSEIDAVRTAQKRAREVFEEELIKSVKGSSKKIVTQRFRAEVYEKPITAMLPAWFLTFRYKDKPYTIIVNGQTGKAVGGVPWNKVLFTVLTVTLAIITSVVFIFILSKFLPFIFSSSSSSSNNNGNFIVFLIAGSIASITAGIKKIKRVLNSIARTTASTLTSYVGKRQKGE